MIVRWLAMTASPSTTHGPPSEKKKKKRKLTTAWATVIAAIIGAGAGFLGGYLPQKNQGTTTATPSLGVSITSPTYQISPVGEVFSGQVEGLGPGQTIWLFSKQLTNPSGPTSAGVLVVNQGPCDITGTAWTCPDVGIGGNHPKDNGSYQVWVAVVDPSQARELQDDIAHHSSVIQGDEPPHADGGIDSENVTRSS